MIMPRVLIKSDGADEFIALVSRVTAVNAVKQQRGVVAMMFAVTIMSFAIEEKNLDQCVNTTMSMALAMAGTDKPPIECCSVAKVAQDFGIRSFKHY